MNQRSVDIYQIRHYKRLISFFISLFIFILSWCPTHAQNDVKKYFAIDTLTTSRRLFGIGGTGGLSIANYNSIRSYPWMLGTPSNILPQFFADFYFGNPEKIYLSAAIVAGSYNKTGSFSDSNSLYNSTVSTTIVSLGGKLGRELVYKDDRHFFNALYASVGGIYTLSINSAYFYRNNTTGLEDVAEYDASSVMLNMQAMVDLADINFSKQGAKAKLEFVLIAGYNLPIQHLQWLSTSKFPDNTIPSTVNIGGAYITLGLNYWVYFKKHSR